MKCMHWMLIIRLILYSLMKIKGGLIRFKRFLQLLRVLTMRKCLKSSRSKNFCSPDIPNDNKQITTISYNSSTVLSLTSQAISLEKVENGKSSIEKRFVFTFLGFLGLFTCFSMRFILNMTLIAMVKPPKKLEAVFEDKNIPICAQSMENKQMTNNSAANLDNLDGFDWDSKQQHLALASFFFGYVTLQIPGGLLAERYSAKHVVGIGILVCSVFILLTPLAAKYSIEALIGVRTVQGLAQALTWPAMNTLIGRWAPVMERSRMSSIINIGSTLGVVVIFAVSGLLSESTFLGGWPSVYYIFGTIGCLWCILWTFFVFDSPEEHPYITKSELTYIKEGNKEINKKTPVPWKRVLTSVPVWSLLITHFGQDWGNYTLLNETPIYLNNVLHFDLQSNGFLSALPNLINMVIANLSGLLADKLRQSGRIGITPIRKIINSIGFYGTGVCMLLISFVGCSPTIIVVLICLATSLNGCVYAGFYVTPVDMCPEFAGTLVAIVNTIANLTGFLVPLFVGWVMNNENTLSNWNIVFITAFAVFVFCGTVFNLFSSSDLQEWNETAKSENELEKETQNPVQMKEQW